MSRYRTVAGWSAGLLATAAAAVLTASAILPGSAAHLEVDGGVLQVFVLDGPDNVPGPPGGLPPGSPDGLPGGPSGGVPGGPPDGGPPEGVPGGPPDVTGPPVNDPAAGSQSPSDQPSDEVQKPDEPSGEPDEQSGNSDPSPADPDPGQQQSVQDSKDEE